jgi:hypothetical protein
MKGENYETGIFGGNDLFYCDCSRAPLADPVPGGGDRGEYDGANVDECSGVSIYGWIGDSFVAREPEKVAGKSRSGIGFTLSAVFDLGIAIARKHQAFCQRPQAAWTARPSMSSSVGVFGDNRAHIGGLPDYSYIGRTIIPLLSLNCDCRWPL